MEWFGEVKERFVSAYFASSDREILYDKPTTREKKTTILTIQIIPHSQVKTTCNCRQVASLPRGLSDLITASAGDSESR